MAVTKMRTFTLRLPEELHAAAVALAKATGISLSRLVQESLAAAIREQEDQGLREEFDRLGREGNCDVGYAFEAQREVVIRDADLSVQRGDLYWVCWSPGCGSEQVGRRPSLVVQMDLANSDPIYPDVVVVALSTKGRDLPWHARIESTSGNGLPELSYVKCEQMMSIAKGHLGPRLGRLSDDDMRRVEDGLRRVLDL